MKKIITIGIIGGGEFGKLVIKHLTPINSKIVGFDNNTKVKFPEKVEKSDLITVIKSDILILAVPFSSYKRLLPIIAKSIKSKTLLVDVCSVKQEPTRIFKIYNLFNLKNILITHPLFGPQSSLSGIKNKTIVVTHKKGNLAIHLLEQWEAKGIIIREMTPEKHDLEMANVQALTFFVGRSLLEMNIKQSEFKTMYFEKLLSLIELEKHHSLELYNSIQKNNPYARQVRKQFLGSANRLHLRSNNNIDLNELRNTIDDIDEECLLLLSERFKITRKIGEIKAKDKLSSLDIKRENNKFKKIEIIAENTGLSKDLVNSLFRLIMDEVVKNHKLFKENLKAKKDQS